MLAVVLIVVTVAAASVAGAVYISLDGSAQSSGSDISCTSQANSSAVQITITNGASNPSNAPGYSPDNALLIIGKNNTVTWTNDDPVHHTVTTTSAPSGASFNSGNMNQGASFTCTFTQPGTYRYYCVYHSWMVGTILVEASS